MKYNEILTFYKSFNQSQYIQSSGKDGCPRMKNTVEGWNFVSHCRKIKRRYKGRKLNGLDLSLHKNPLLFAWQHTSKNLVNQQEKHRKFVKLWCVMQQVLNSTKPGFSKGNQLYCLHTFFYFCYHCGRNYQFHPNILRHLCLPISAKI